MMTSIDLSSSSNNAANTPFTSTSNRPHPQMYPHHRQHQHQHFHGGLVANANDLRGSGIPIGSSHHSRHTSFTSPTSHSRQLQPPSSTSEAGRQKTEQVMIECFYKLTELILQSRVHLLVENERDRGNRRARFNLDIEEIPLIREGMNVWKEDIHVPLTIDIYGEDPQTQASILLEQWSVVYVSSNGTFSPGTNPGDVMQQLKDVVKKISVLLRALHSLMRQLPAHRFFRQTYPSSLSYTLQAVDESSTSEDPSRRGQFEEDVAISRYSFVPIHSPFGFLKLSTVYRRDCSILEVEEQRPIQQTSMLQDNFIIQDYVPASPEQQQMAALESAMSTHILSSPSTNMIRTAEEPPSPTRAKSHRERMIQPMSPRVQGDRYSYDDNRTSRRSNPPQMMEERPIAMFPATERRGSKIISQPMAIPQQIKPTVPLAYEEEALEEVEQIQHQSMMKGNVTHHRRQQEQPHPHSYAEPERLRTIATNPNITAAPYGYGNAVIERGHTPPTASGFSSGSGGNAGGFSGSFQDQLISSPHPSSTPPRHPHSLLTPRTASGRLLLSTGKSRMNSNEVGAHASSLENFVLDGGALAASPSPTQHTANYSPSVPSSRSLGRHHSLQFNDQASNASSHEKQASPPSAVGTSPQLTPPFMAAESPATIPPRVPLPSAALVVRASHNPSADRNLWIFSSSPPFQANPTELLSTSPGYTFSKHYRPVIRRRHTVGTDTNPSALVRTNSLSRGAFENSTETSTLSKTRTFSADLCENSVGVWGISPDSPDTFGLALAGSTRRGLVRFGEENESTRRVSNASSPPDDVDELNTSEFDMMMLPFAIGDVDNVSTATTTTSSEGVGARDRDSSTETRSVSAWDTASVGSFLQQLKYAPRLQVSGTTPFVRARSTSRQDTSPPVPLTPGTESSQSQRRQPSRFDSELESFRQLRDTLTQTS